MSFSIQRENVPKLSEQRHAVKDATTPLPLYTCLHVRRNETAQAFCGKMIRKVSYLIIKEINVSLVEKFHLLLKHVKSPGLKPTIFIYIIAQLEVHIDIEILAVCRMCVT